MSLVNIRQADVERGSSSKQACVTTGIDTTIRPSAATRNPIRLGLWMAQACMGMRVGVLMATLIRMGVKLEKIHVRRRKIASLKTGKNVRTDASRGQWKPATLKRSQNCEAP